MEYLYSVTATYDGDKSPHWIGRYDNALDAVGEFNKFVDYGLASEYAIWHSENEMNEYIKENA
jgi:hypothetical protein